MLVVALTGVVGLYSTVSTPYATKDLTRGGCTPMAINPPRALPPLYSIREYRLTGLLGSSRTVYHSSSVYVYIIFHSGKYDGVSGDLYHRGYG